MSKNKNQRTVTLSFRVTEDEAAAIRKKAEKEEVPMSEWIRGRALSGDDFVSKKRMQDFFRKKMILADEFQKVKRENEKQGSSVELSGLGRSIHRLWL